MTNTAVEMHDAVVNRKATALQMAIDFVARTKQGAFEPVVGQTDNVLLFAAKFEEFLNPANTTPDNESPLNQMRNLELVSPTGIRLASESSTDRLNHLLNKAKFKDDFAKCKALAIATNGKVVGYLNFDNHDQKGTLGGWYFSDSTTFEGNNV
jgi:hypothetical protein